MGRINALLLMAVVACALMVVSTQHRARILFIDHERALQAGRQLDVEWNQLQLDQVALAKATRVDELARQKLKMLNPPSAQVRFVPLELGPSTQGAK